MLFQPAFAKHLSLFLCIKYLCRKKIVLLSIASVMISSALLIVVASLFSGFIDSIETTVTDHSADIVIGADSVKIPKYRQLITELENSPGIDSATASLSGLGGLLYLDKGNVRAVKIKGIELPKAAEVTSFSEFLIVQNDPQSKPVFSNDAEVDGAFAGIGVVAIPDEKTDEYDLEKVKQQYLGQTVGLTTVRGADQKPMLIKLTLTDFVYSGFYMSDSDCVYVPLEFLNKKLFPENENLLCDTIQIKIADSADLTEQTNAAFDIWYKFATEELGWSDFAMSRVRVETSHKRWEILINEYRKQMNMLIVIFSIVSVGVILLIACIFYLIVMTKRKDIAVVKSCGLGAGAVTSLFVSFGLLIGLVGSGLGVGLGYIFVRNINMLERYASMAFGIKLWKSSTYMFTRIPSQIDWQWAGLIFIVAVIAAGVGALIPAIIAACIRPVKILRYE